MSPSLVTISTLLKLRHPIVNICKKNLYFCRHARGVCQCRNSLFYSALLSCGSCGYASIPPNHTMYITKELIFLGGAAHLSGCTPPLSSPTRLQSLASNIPSYERTVVERRQRRPIHCPSPEYNTFVFPMYACRI